MTDANPPLRATVPAAKGYSRGRHRARSHDSAHAEGAEHFDQAVPQHPLIPQGSGELVTTNAQLAELIQHLRAAGQFAYDSEFIGEMSYHPRLCLIQVGSAQRIALIDPFSDIELQPFWELLCDPAVEKIVHAGEQDMEPVVRHLGRSPVNFLDTQIAAGFIGMAYPVALSKLVAEVIGAKLGKGLTFTDWSQRPLSAVQLRYAADDVRYLPAVREKLVERLEPLAHLAWAKEESEAMGHASRFVFDPMSDYMRVRGAGSLPPQNLAVLRELTIWREEAAKKADAPPRAYLKDEILIDMARSPIKSVEKLDRVRGLPRPVEAEYGTVIVEATHRGLATPPGDMPPRTPEPTPTQRFAADSIWAALQVICTGRSIDPNLVTSRQEIGELQRNLAAKKDISNLRLMKGWRRKAAGEPLLNLLRSEMRIELDWANEALRANLKSN